MKLLLDAGASLSLLWPLLVCAIAWGIVIWALRQHDPLSDAVNHLLAPRPAGKAAREPLSRDAASGRAG